MHLHIVFSYVRRYGRVSTFCVPIEMSIVCGSSFMHFRHPLSMWPVIPVLQYWSRITNCKLLSRLEIPNLQGQNLYCLIRHFSRRFVCLWIENLEVAQGTVDLFGSKGTCRTKAELGWFEPGMIKHVGVPMRPHHTRAHYTLLLSAGNSSVL